MAEQSWKTGDVITAERLNRMQELATNAYDESLKQQIAELKLLCDESGKIWGAAATDLQGCTVTIPAMTITMQPITFQPVSE